MRLDNAADRELLDHVYPGDYKNPTPGGRYNLVVIGAGTAGLITAAGAAGLGAKVALIERTHLGGDCLNVGCVPSKALLRSAHLAGEMAAAESLGLQLPGPVEVDFTSVMERMRGVRTQIAPHDSVERYSNELGIDVFLGEGRFTGAGTIAVGDATLHYARAVVATGAHAFVPPIPGLADVDFLTNENVFDLTERPDELLVIGGGPIGCELSQAFARLGSRVTIVELAPQFLGREDPDAAALLFESIRNDGVEVRLNSQVTRIEALETGGQAFVERDGKEEVVRFDQVLVAIGRSPNVEGLGLEEVGVAFDARRGVHVDDHLRTANKHIYAAGDVCMAYKFTHAADFAARTVIQNSLFFGRKKLSALNIPWCTYTEPEIAHVGLYERDARAKGIEVDTYTEPFSGVDRAITEARTEGFVRVHVRKGTDKILGATIVGHGAGDLISEISVAMAGKLGLGALANVIHPYPTRADAIRAVAAQYVRTRLTPGIKGLFERFLAVRR